MDFRVLVFSVITICSPSLLFSQKVDGSKSASVDRSEESEPSIKSVPEGVSKVSKPPQMDPVLYSILLEEPPLRIQESIVYLDGTGTSWVLCSLDPSSATRVRWRGAPMRTILPPSGSTLLGLCYGKSALWCTVGSDAASTLELFRFGLNQATDGWKKVGMFDGKGGIPSLVVPLKKEGCFLGISSHCLQEADTDRGSFAGVFRNREGELHLESCIELPFDDLHNIVKGEWLDVPVPQTRAVPEVECVGKPNRLWMGHADPPILTPTLRLPSLSEDFLVLGAASAGVLWILDLEDGHLCRTINLTGLRRQDLSKIAAIQHVILGTGFAPDGGLIVASKDPNLIKLTVSLNLDKPDSQEKDLRTRDFESFLKEMKEVHWWRIDPQTGSQEHLDSPLDFPQRMPTATRQTAFRFLVDPFGHVKTNAFTSWSKVMNEFLATVPAEAQELNPKE